MKSKILALACISAMALTVAYSCKRENLDAPTNPTYDAQKGEVTVDFVLNVATGNTETKMSAANTQATLDQTFRGIENAALMTFKQGSANDGKHLAAPGTADKHYDMGTLITAGALDPDATGTSVPKSRRVLELALPTESNTILFWGKAIKSGTSAQQGSVDWNINKDLSNISFTLTRRIPNDMTTKGETAFKQWCNLLSTALTKVVQTSVHYDVSFPPQGANPESKEGDLAWSDYVNIVGETLQAKATSPVTPTEDMDPLGEILAGAFVTMNTIYSNEVRAGAASSVARLLGDLYEVINSVASATPTSLEETASKVLAEKILNNISQVIQNPTTNPMWVTNVGTIKTFSGLDETLTNLIANSDPNNFPANFNVPKGAATLKYDTATNTYTYNEAIPTYAMDGTAGGSFNIFNYRYPAELCYFGNSPIRVTDDAHVTADYPDGTDNWDNDNSWIAGATGTGSKAWTTGHVLSSTRSVAMKNNINYGNAILKTTVRYGADILQDNNAAIQLARTGAHEDNATISATAGAFTLTGILIGGVEETMGWNYLAKAAEPSFSSFIYDGDLPSTAIPAYTAEGAKSVPNYTLTWDNWNPDDVGNKQNVVYVALEFVNNTGKDFWGMNNLIRNGATFYITGKMDPDAGLSTTDRSEGITWPTKYALPPYNADGSTIQERRIFIQDFMTEADFIITSTSLQSAIISVPDLRSTQISLGLSVDLKWSTGLKFPGINLGE